MSDPTCSIGNGKCVDNRMGNQVACYRCDLNTHGREVLAKLTVAEYQFIKDLCEADQTPIPEALGRMVRLVIGDLRRAEKRL